MKNNHKLGAILAVLGIVAGLLCLYFIADTYNTVIHTHFAAGEWEESNTVRLVYAVLGWLGTAAGALSASVLWGFLKKQDWAWFWGAVAATILLLAGFFPMIPAADSGLPVPTMWVFLLAAVMWFGMLFIGGVQKGIIGLTFTAGLAYVLTFIDGVAPVSKFQTTFQAPTAFVENANTFWNGLYVLSQQVNWWGAAAWAIFIFAALKRKSWAAPVGIFAAVMSMIGGYPMGIHNVAEVQRFSMFLPAPILSTILLIVLLLPGTQKMLGVEQS
ncbi:MAG: hypothetical protein QY329_10670 [Anaerolineales bacterium]|nr:MAG: hypothetical protein QY329_10670 [Anaerolineales bacterium]